MKGDGDQVEVSAAYAVDDRNSLGIVLRGLYKWICIYNERHGNVTSEQDGEMIKARRPVRKWLWESRWDMPGTSIGE